MPKSLRELIEGGVLRPPIELERTYKGRRFTARVEADGAVTFDGQRFKSLSVAGAMARAKALNRSSYQATNGWVFWQVRQADGRLVRVDSLRRRG
jgi:hypothetical protein